MAGARAATGGMGGEGGRGRRGRRPKLVLLDEEEPAQAKPGGGCACG